MISQGQCVKNSESKNEIHLAFEQEVKTLDPILASDNYSTEVIQNIYEGLYHFHYTKRPYQLEPLLAESLPQIDKTKKIITIKLRKNARFQDSPIFKNGKGRLITIDDVIYSWKRTCSPQSGSVNSWIFDNKIIGLEDWKKQINKNPTNFKNDILGFKKIDSQTLQIKLTKPNYQFLLQLTHAGASIVPHEAVEYFKNDFATNPVGSGAYKIEKWIRGNEISLIKNGNYTDAISFEDTGNINEKNNSHKLSLTEKVIIKFFQQEQTMWLNFLKGYIDHATRIPRDFFDSVVKNGKLSPEYENKNLNLQINPNLDVTYIGFNHEHPLLKNKKIRQALVSAFNNKLSLEVIHKGRGILAESPIPPGLEGYSSIFKNPYAYNFMRAQKLINESQVDKAKLVLDYDFPGLSSSHRQFAIFNAEMFKKLGFKVNLNAGSWPEFEQKIKTKSSMLFDMSWSADYPDAENFFQLFYCKNISPGPNSFNYCNKEYDAMYEASLFLEPGHLRELHYKKMISLLTEDAVAIFNVHRSDHTISHHWLKNFRKDKMIKDFYKYLRIDFSQKEHDIKKL